MKKKSSVLCVMSIWEHAYERNVTALESILERVPWLADEPGDACDETPLMLVLTPRGPHPAYDIDDTKITHCVRVLLRYGAVPGMWHIRRALWNGWMDTLQELVRSPKLAISPKEFTPCMEACLHGNPVALSIFLKAGADPNAQIGRTFRDTKTAWPTLPLHIAIVSGSLQCVLLLLQYGADPYKEDGGRTALDWVRYVQCQKACIHSPTLNALTQLIEGMFHARDSFCSVRDMLHKELIETVFHPQRLHRLGYFSCERAAF